jgi:hypothetical protein
MNVSFLLKDQCYDCAAYAVATGRSGTNRLHHNHLFCD